jgi:hypothetical protein
MSNVDSAEEVPLIKKQQLKTLSKHLRRKSKSLVRDFRANLFAQFSRGHSRFPKQGGFSAESNVQS